MGGRRKARIAIIGAGVSGICLAVKLKLSGNDDFVVFDRGGTVGGVWRENVYPGVSCDVPSRIYSFSFAPNPDWDAYFARGDEIRSYLDRVVERYGIGPHLRLGEEVVEARFVAGEWRVLTARGVESRWDFLIAATGLLVQPALPELEGRNAYRGVAMHSAQWESGVDVRGKRVAIIGTGATGTQMTCALAEETEHLYLFQRTAQWVFPKPARRYSVTTKGLHRLVPGFSRLADRFWRVAFQGTISAAAVSAGWQRRLIGGICRLSLRQVRSKELRRLLTPVDDPMCKRLVAASGFYRAVQQQNVTVVGEEIERITERGILTRDGREREVDVMVFATGFRADTFMRSVNVVGRAGRTIEDVWSDGPRAYRTVALPGFPNFFMMVGPNSPFSSESVMRIAETQSDYVLRWIELFESGAVAEMSPTQEAADRFNELLRSAMPGTVFSSGCASWYHDSRGSLMVWPWTVRSHHRMLSRIQLSHFDIRQREEAGRSGPGSESGACP
ncbi:NAD(P)/FAD-dependent oxidoreductase [Kitasatospora sp. NPDC004723]|uniref:flavin-containing monooxygenase n=1 Tax=Kitasatospora sp. NPDC004723 TaxID=3154288 RepID=UPI0033A47D6D